LPSHDVEDEKRQRILAGAATALSEHGYAELSVAQIIAAAGISRTTFYQHFENKRECVLVAHEQAFDRLAAELESSCAAESEWPEKVAAALSTVIAFAVQKPEQARLLLLEVLAADSVLARQARASNEILVDLMRKGRELCPEADTLPQLTERALVSGTTAVISRRLLHDEADELAALAPELIELNLIPYVGSAEAARAAKNARPVPDIAPE